MKDAVLGILDDPARLAEIKQQLSLLRTILAEKRTSEQMLNLVKNLLGIEV